MYKNFNAKINKNDIGGMIHHVKNLESKISLACSCPSKRHANGKVVRNCKCGEGVFDFVKNTWGKTWLGKKVMGGPSQPQQPQQPEQ